MRFIKKSRKKSKYSEYISDVKCGSTIDINVFDPERICDLELINKERSNYKFKVSKIACIAFLLLSVPLTAFATEINSSNIINLTNRERSRNNIQILTENSELASAADSKANDMLNNRYFEHFSPDGKTPWNFIKGNNYDYRFAGENLAMDFKTSEGIHNAWMKSGSHKKNILNSNYEEIGIGIVKGDFNGNETTMVVQMFGTKKEKMNTNAHVFISRIAGFLGVEL